MFYSLVPREFWRPSKLVRFMYSWIHQLYANSLMSVSFSRYSLAVVYTMQFLKPISIPTAIGDHRLSFTKLVTRLLSWNLSVLFSFQWCFILARQSSTLSPVTLHCDWLRLIPMVAYNCLTVGSRTACSCVVFFLLQAISTESGFPLLFVHFNRVCLLSQ